MSARNLKPKSKPKPSQNKYGGEDEDISTWQYPSTNDASEGLLHELQKRQIELEIQNEALRASFQELRQVHEALEDTSRLSTTLFDANPGGIAVCQMRLEAGVAVDFKYLRVNPAFTKLTGMPDPVGHWICELIPGIRESHPAVFELYGRVASGGAPENFEVYVDQLKIWLEITAFNLQPGQFVAVFNAITSQRLLREELRESAERLQLALRAAKLGTWDVDRISGRVVYDRRWCEILGYSMEEIVPTIESWRKLIHPQDKNRAFAALNAHERGDAPMYDCEYRLRHKEGHWVWISSQGQIVDRDSLGNATRILGTLKDISAEKRFARDGAEFSDEEKIFGS